MIRNGWWTREVVITHPDHLREFYRKDAKGICFFFLSYSDNLPYM